MLIRFLHPLWEDDGGADGGDKDEGGKVRASDLRSQLGATPDEGALMRLLEKHAEVLTDNSQLRAQRRTLRQEVTDLKAKQPVEGGRVLTKEEAAAYDAYVALGEPAKVKTSLEAAATATQRLTALERTDALRAAAEAHGYKAGVLGELRSLDGKAIETREMEVEGQKVKRAFVKDGATETLLPDYLSQQAPDVLAALAAEPPPPAGTSYVAQSVGGKPAPTNPGKAYVATQKYAIPGKTG
jgi:hypothetical protein